MNFLTKVKRALKAVRVENKTPDAEVARNRARIIAAAVVGGVTLLTAVPQPQALSLPPTMLSPLRFHVMNFGAKGDGVTDDAPAINKALNYLRTINASGNTFQTLLFGGAPSNSYLVNSSLNFTGLRLFHFEVDFGGATIICKSTGKPMIDALDSQYLHFRNGVFYGDATSTPNYGIQMGRGILGNDAPNCSHTNLIFTGSYSAATFLNSGCEVFKADKCLYWNSANAPCLVQDAGNFAHITSQFFTVTATQDTLVSHNDNIFINCNFEQLHGGTAAISLWGPLSTGATNSHQFIKCYAQSASADIIEIRGNHAFLDLDIHCEPANVVSNIVLRTDLSSMVLTGFKHKEYYGFCTNSVIRGLSTTNTAYFYNSEIYVNAVNSAVPIFGSSSKIDFHGTLRIGASTSLYNLSNLNVLNATIICQASYSNLSLPFLNSIVVQNHDEVAFQYNGTHDYKFCTIKEGDGFNVASAATMPEPGPGRMFYITGTTDIYGITVTSVSEGREITWRFAGVLTVYNANLGNLILAGNFTTTNGSTLTLRCTGGKWYEICRSANVIA